VGRLRCRVEPYWIKAAALRAATPGRAHGGRAALGADPPQRAGLEADEHSAMAQLSVT
jgi:hypothetical protein